VEITGARPAGDFRRSAVTDRDDGIGESDVGEERIANELLLKLISLSS